MSTPQPSNIDSESAARLEEIAASLVQIRDLCRRMQGLLDDEEGRGMLTWHQAINSVGKELHVALGETFGLVTDSAVATAIDFMCSQLDNTSARLGTWKDRGCAGKI